MFRASPEKLVRLNADRHQSKRFFRRFGDRELRGVVGQVVACWRASLEDRWTTRDQALDPAEVEDRFRVHLHLMAAGTPTAASREALSLLQGKDELLGFPRAPRQIRALVEVLRERGLHHEAVRLAAWCLVCSPQAHPRPLRFGMGGPSQDAHTRALLDVETRGEFCF